MDKKDINQQVKQVEKAFKIYKNCSGKQKALFLKTIGEEILALGDNLLEIAHRESNLPLARLTGERGRTIGQLNSFAALLEEGSWVNAIIDTAQPDRQPLPKPDIRKMLQPLGTVLVFGASNFPLAFSTAGGDTASALAAGCGVVVKAHFAHVETSRLVAQAIWKAAEKTNIPKNIFAHIEGDIQEGVFLTKHATIKAVGFTGSYLGGKSLFDIANRRSVPIPVFAEMGSTNPVFLLENALQERNETLASQLADSVTLGVGQFCTKPGIIIGIESDDFRHFSQNFKTKMAEKNATPMLHEGIAKNYKKGIKNIENQAVTSFSSFNEKEQTLTGNPVVTEIIGKDFFKNKIWQEEIFGPYALVVACKDKVEMYRIAQSLHGQLTTTIMAEAQDFQAHKKLIELLAEKCGRLLLNNVPTGVEVTTAMQHGGPFPATTDSRFTSVGTDAIYRWVRPIAYQNFPDKLLPDALKTANPLSITRKVNGSLG